MGIKSWPVCALINIFTAVMYRVRIINLLGSPGGIFCDAQHLVAPRRLCSLMGLYPHGSNGGQDRKRMT